MAATGLYDQLPENHVRFLRFTHRIDDEVELACIMEVVDLGSKPLYHALSYTWNDPVMRTQCCDAHDASATYSRSILINGLQKPITPNLYDALMRLTRTGHTLLNDCYVWIDAICINQEDSEEKTRQVRRMDHIFEHANAVLVWLGEEDEYTKKAFQLLILLSRVPHTEYAEHSTKPLEDVFPAVDHSGWSSLGSFLS